MTFPDQLKQPAPGRQGGSDALGDFLWEVISWDPNAERELGDLLPAAGDLELVAAAQRLLDEGLLAEPSMSYRAWLLLDELGQLAAPGTEARGPADEVRPPGDTQAVGTEAVGRETERALGLRQASRLTPGIRLLCITGSAGIGKTQLAREIGAAVREKAMQAGYAEKDVPLLEVSMSSSMPGMRIRQLAKAPSDALGELLLSLGHDGAPDDLPDQKERYAAELACQRPVILIDGAIDESQVWPLLPPGDGVVLVTSRMRLPALHELGARYLPLTPLDAAASRRLIRACFAAAGVTPGAETLDALVAWTGGLPVPTIVTARWMAASLRRGQTEATLLELAADAVRRQAGQPFAAVLGLLDADQVAVIETASLLRLPETDIASAGIGTGLDQERAASALRQLEAGACSRAAAGTVPGLSRRTWPTASARALSRRATPRSAGTRQSSAPSLICTGGEPERCRSY